MNNLKCDFEVVKLTISKEKDSILSQIKTFNQKETPSNSIFNYRNINKLRYFSVFNGEYYDQSVYQKP